MTLRQRQPREELPAYLEWVRKQPCTICLRPGPNDAAHIRSMSREHGKDITGWRKPSDRWTLPLCRTHHEDQHRHEELAWWSRHGIDPFAAAEALFASWPGSSRPRAERRKIVKTKPRKPKSQRAKIVGRTQIPSRQVAEQKRIEKDRAMTLRDDLIAAKALIDAPEKWHPGWMAVPADAGVFDVGSAIRAAVLQNGDTSIRGTAVACDALDAAVPTEFVVIAAQALRPYVQYLDRAHPTHADIMALFDRAIAASEPAQ